MTIARAHAASPALHRLRWLGPLGAYGLVSLAATWPLVLHLQGWVPGRGDWGQNLWALWWTRQALLGLGQSPFFTQYLFYPEGVTLLFHPLDVADGLLAVPFYGTLGGDITYNLMVLLSFVLGGWGAYLLALYLTGQRGPSFVAGLIFALSPYHLLRLDLGHLNLATIQWLPFYTLFLLKFLEQGSRRAGSLAVFFLVLTALHSWYYVAYLGLLSLALVFWPRRHSLPCARQGIRSLARVALVLAAALVILAPLLVPMVRLYASTTFIGEHNPLRHSVDLYSFWVPGPPSTWAGWFQDVWVSYAAQHREPGASAYPGYTVLALSLAALTGRRWRRQAAWWLIAGLGFTILALGPQLQIDGQVLDRPLPYQFLNDLVPLWSLTGIPGRMVVMTSLALAMAAAYGLSRLASRWGARAGFLWLAAGLLVGLEYLAVPMELSSTGVADFYRGMANDREVYAVLDIKWDANFLLHAQTIHGKPLIGGWLARLPKEQARYLDQGTMDRAFLYLLLGPDQGDLAADPAALRPAIQAALVERQVRYIIDHDNAAGPWLEQVLGWPRVYEADGVVVYGATR